MTWATLSREERTAAITDGIAGGLDPIKIARRLKAAPAAIELHAARYAIQFKGFPKGESPVPAVPKASSGTPAPGIMKQPANGGGVSIDGGRHEVATEPEAGTHEGSTSPASAPAPDVGAVRTAQYDGIGWTIQRVEALKLLVQHGDSCSQIAFILGGGLTRNAVIGKIHRLRLTPTQKSARAARAPLPRRLPRSPTVARRPHQQPREAPEPVRPAPRPELPEPQPIGVTLLNLTNLTCKWPLGGFADPAALFCGNLSFGETPYCEYHARLAYVPRATRQRVDQRLSG